MHPLYRALFNLVDQIDKSDFKDSLGQSAKMLQAMKEAKKVLVEYAGTEIPPS